MDLVQTVASLFTDVSDSTSSSSTSSYKNRRSVFADHYIPTSKALLNDEDWRKKTYLQISASTLSSVLSSLGSSNNILSGLLGGVSSSSSSTTTSTTFSENDFWELIVTEYTESHSEKFGAHNALSESFCWFATGPKPVEITMTAMFMTSETKDWRTYFMYMYTAALRAKQLTNYDRTLTLVMKDTTMLLYIKSLAFTETSELSGYSTMTLTGFAYKYKNIYSIEPTTITTYSGTEAAVETTQAGETKSLESVVSSGAGTSSSYGTPLSS